MYKYAGKEIYTVIEHLQTQQSMQSSLGVSQTQLLLIFIAIKTLFYLERPSTKEASEQIYIHRIELETVKVHSQLFILY